MRKTFLLSFTRIAAIAVLAVDYVNKARIAGSAPGVFGLAAYRGTVSVWLGLSGGTVAAESAVATAASPDTPAKKAAPTRSTEGEPTGTRISGAPLCHIAQMDRAVRAIRPWRDYCRAHCPFGPEVRG